MSATTTTVVDISRRSRSTPACLQYITRSEGHAQQRPCDVLLNGIRTSRSLRFHHALDQYVVFFFLKRLSWKITDTKEQNLPVFCLVKQFRGLKEVQPTVTLSTRVDAMMEASV